MATSKVGESLHEPVGRITEPRLGKTADVKDNWQRQSFPCVDYRISV